MFYFVCNIPNIAKHQVVGERSEVYKNFSPQSATLTTKVIQSDDVVF